MVLLICTVVHGNICNIYYAPLEGGFIALFPKGLLVLVGENSVKTPVVTQRTSFIRGDRGSPSKAQTSTTGLPLVRRSSSLGWCWLGRLCARAHGKRELVGEKLHIWTIVHRALYTGNIYHTYTTLISSD